MIFSRIITDSRTEHQKQQVGQAATADKRYVQKSVHFQIWERAQLRPDPSTHPDPHINP
jgi:hypothetical protein